MKKFLPAILASSLYWFPLSACSKPDKPDQPATDQPTIKPAVRPALKPVPGCPTEKGNLSRLEKELSGYGFKLYSHSAAPDKARLILVGYNPLEPSSKLSRLAYFVARYVQDGDTVLVEGEQKGKKIGVKPGLRAKNKTATFFRCLPGQNVNAYGATPNVQKYQEFLETLGAYDPFESAHTALEIVIEAEVQHFRRDQEEGYLQLLKEHAKEQIQPRQGQSQGRVYAVIDYEYVTNGRFTLNLKREGIPFLAVSPPHKKLEQIIAPKMRGFLQKGVMLTIQTEKGKVRLPYRDFTVRGAPLTLPEAIVINKGEVEYSGDEKEKYTSDRGEKVSLSPGKKYTILDKDIVDMYE